MAYYHKDNPRFKATMQTREQGRNKNRCLRIKRPWESPNGRLHDKFCEPTCLPEADQ